MSLTELTRALGTVVSAGREIARQTADELLVKQRPEYGGKTLAEALITEYFRDRSGESEAQPQEGPEFQAHRYQPFGQSEYGRQSETFDYAGERTPPPPPQPPPPGAAAADALKQLKACTHSPRDALTQVEAARRQHERALDSHCTLKDSRIDVPDSHWQPGLPMNWEERVEKLKANKSRAERLVGEIHADIAKLPAVELRGEVKALFDETLGDSRWPWQTLASIPQNDPSFADQVDRANLKCCWNDPDSAGRKYSSEAAEQLAGVLDRAARRHHASLHPNAALRRLNSARVMATAAALAKRVEGELGKLGSMDRVVVWLKANPGIVDGIMGPDLFETNRITSRGYESKVHTTELDQSAEAVRRECESLAWQLGWAGPNSERTGQR